MTREEFNSTNIDIRDPCPDCGSYDKYSKENCKSCIPSGNGMKHIYKNHHSCGGTKKEKPVVEPKPKLKKGKSNARKT